MLAWPDAAVVDRAVRQWAREVARRSPEVIRIGYFGSYARGDWGAGSDVDLILIVERADEPFARRPIRWDTTRLPVPAEAVVYTAGEWASMAHGRFGQTVSREAVWVYKRTHPSAGTFPRASNTSLQDR